MDNRHVVQALAVGKPSAPPPMIFVTTPSDPIDAVTLQRRWIGGRFALSTELTDIVAGHLFGRARA